MFFSDLSSKYNKYNGNFSIDVKDNIRKEIEYYFKQKSDFDYRYPGCPDNILFTKNIVSNNILQEHCVKIIESSIICSIIPKNRELKMKKSNIIPCIKYVILTVKHKWFVFLAGFKLKVSIFRLLFHDMSKFTLKELPHYGRNFFGEKNDPNGFIKCWIHHQNHNDHHWEYWIPRTGNSKCNPPYPDNLPIEMPESAIREMIADWIGASKAYEGKWPDFGNWYWYEKNKERIIVHPNTRKKIDKIIGELL